MSRTGENIYKRKDGRWKAQFIHRAAASAVGGVCGRYRALWGSAVCPGVVFGGRCFVWRRRHGVRRCGRLRRFFCGILCGVAAADVPVHQQPARADQGGDAEGDHRKPVVLHAQRIAANGRGDNGGNACDGRQPEIRPKADGRQPGHIGQQILWRARNKEHQNWSDAYYLDIWLTPKNCHEIRVKPTISQFNGKVYCAETTTGYFLVRRNGKVWITGNSGRGIQLQNLPQNHIVTLDEARELVKMGCFDMIEALYGNTPDILSQLIRTMLIPKDGCEFIVADFSAIEARVLAWLAGEQWRLDAFKEGKDIYCASASQMFGVPVVKHGINGELRQKGKVAELACGYGGGAGALISMGALDMGLKEDELPEIISSWRDANPEIVKFWYAIEKAAIETVKDHTDRTVGRIGFQFSANTLWIVLPSGRRLAYIKPKLQPNRFGRMALTFEGLGANNKWTRDETYSGKLTENITQATARDLLAEAMRRMELVGLGIVGHVHDEVILEVSKGKYTVNDVCGIMNRNPAWADGLPLASDGYTGDYYFKS